MYERIVESVKYPKQATIFPGSLLHEVAKFMLTNRIEPKSGYLWYTNVTTMVAKYSNKRVLNAIDRLRRQYGLVIQKPTNARLAKRRHVWQVMNPERVRFYIHPTVEEDTRP